MGEFCQLDHVILVWVISSFMSGSGFACRCLFWGASRQRSTFSRWNMREICSYRHIRADTRCELVKIPSCCKETWDVMYPSSIVALRLQLEKGEKRRTTGGPCLKNHSIHTRRRIHIVSVATEAQGVKQCTQLHVACQTTNTCAINSLSIASGDSIEKQRRLGEMVRCNRQNAKSEQGATQKIKGTCLFKSKYTAQFFPKRQYITKKRKEKTQ